MIDIYLWAHICSCLASFYRKEFRVCLVSKKSPSLTSCAFASWSCEVHQCPTISHPMEWVRISLFQNFSTETRFLLQADFYKAEVQGKLRVTSAISSSPVFFPLSSEPEPGSLRVTLNELRRKLCGRSLSPHRTLTWPPNTPTTNCHWILLSLARFHHAPRGAPVPVEPTRQNAQVPQQIKSFRYAAVVANVADYWLIDSKYESFSGPLQPIFKKFHVVWEAPQWENNNALHTLQNPLASAKSAR